MSGATHMAPPPDAYGAFLAAKAQAGTLDGFAPRNLHPALFDFQGALVDWAVRKGRGAIFADCGLGKTLQQLAWADQVVRRENGRVMLLAPLAVTHQTEREAEKFGIEARQALDGKPVAGINIVNYERLHHFEPDDFAAVICDESAILKAFDGVRRKAITEFMRRMRYRLLCTATPSPNEYIELGTSSEALGYLGYMDMLSRFFKTDNKVAVRIRGGTRLDDNAKWRFKGHAEGPFWKWVCSWARAVRKPSDLGFDDGRFILPPLIERAHVVEARSTPEGMMFALPAHGLREQRDERRRTVAERCERAAELVNGTGQPAIVWCQLNDEGDLLERLIPDAVQVSGQDSDDAKVEKFLAFTAQKARVLVTKEKIGAWGLNFQHCAHSVSFPTHSFEAYYQGIRRCWRFGQTREVVADMIATEGERDVLANLQRKASAAEKMFADLVAYMHEAQGVERGAAFHHAEQVPAWL